MINFVFGVLALWVLAHAVTQELPSRNWPKPFSCLFCFTGWICITTVWHMVVVRGWDPGLAMMIAGAFWAAVLFLDALYWRLRTQII